MNSIWMITRRAAMAILLLGLLPVGGYAHDAAAQSAPADPGQTASASPLTSHETVLSLKAGDVLIRHYIRPGRKDKILPWEPTAQELKQLQAAYAAFAPGVGQPDPMRSVLRTDITSYYRQYVPVAQNGKRLILISGLSPTLMAPDMKTAAGRDAWQIFAVYVFDDGRDVFHALYDPEKRKITSFEFGGS